MVKFSRTTFKIDVMFSVPTEAITRLSRVFVKAPDTCKVPTAIDDIFCN